MQNTVARRVIDRPQIDAMEQRYRANFINSLSGYKSANLIGTRSHSGQTNLCIVSSVFHVGANPPLMGMLMRPHTVVRDTLENVKETGFYTINHVSTHWIDKAHQTSARYPKHVSEFDDVGLTAQFNDDFFAPYVAESVIKIGLHVQHIQQIALNATELVIGEIMQLEVPEYLIGDDGYIDIEQATTACVSGLDCYHQAQRLRRFEYAKPDKPVTPIMNAQGR